MNTETSEENKDKVYEAGGFPTDPNTINASLDPEKDEEAGYRDPNDTPDHAPKANAKPVDVVPDGGYGWVCVACVFLMNAHTWGVNSVSY